MSGAAFALQKAVYKALVQDAALLGLLGGSDIFDHTPPSAAFPYITLGQASEFAWDTSTEEGSEILFTLHVWSRRRGRKQTLAIMQAVADVLDGGQLNVSGQNLVNLMLQSSETAYDDDVAVYHGLMRFRAVLEAL